MACDNPFHVTVNKVTFPVPCGRCPPCKIRRVNEWVFRLVKEDEVSLSSYFITLTYDTAHVPLSKNGFMTLHKPDFQKYMKRLRKACREVASEWPPLRYYACGEYGGKTSRPHYHAIVFNCPKEDIFFDAWCLNGVSIGSVVVGTCTSDSIAYCMKYIDKDSWRQHSSQRHKRDDRVKEFALMSKGLGLSYLQLPGVVNFHTSNLENNFVSRYLGNRVPMPRYYRDKLLTDVQKEQQRFIIQNAVHDQKQARMVAHHESAHDYSFEQTEQLRKLRRAQKFQFSQSKRNVL
nr:MAG: replication initiator protein [Microvirus sp.]